MGIGLGIGINRSNYAQGIFNAYQSRVIADGGVTEAGACVDAVSGLLLTASLLLIPSGYKSGKAYAQIPTNGNGDLTWTRASDAWRTNADGLIQRVPWNLVSQSETFENAYWSKINSTLTANVITAPNGTLTADLLVENSANGAHLLNRSSLSFPSTSYTLSIYAKAKERSKILVFIAGSNAKGYGFDLANGTMSAVTGVTASDSYSMTNVGDGWYRCSITITSGTITATEFYPLQNFSNYTYQGDGTSGLYFWGAQLVEGSSAQTYFPTTDRLNVPRLSYMYGSCPALLLEPQRTNLATWSDDFSNAVWAKSNVAVTTNTTTSPDGTTNADKLIASATTSTHILISSAAGSVNGTTVTFSIFAKASELSRIQFVNNAGGSGSAEYNLSAGTVNFASGVSASIVNTGNGWYRCILSYTPTTTGNFNIQIRLLDNSGSTTFTGNGTDGVFIYGAQLEAGAYPTTYIPTTTASATRVADSFSRNNIFTNGLITSSGGTWFVELRGNLAYTRDGTGNFWIGDSSADGSGGSVNSLTFRNNGGGSPRLAINKVINGTLTALYTTTTDTSKIAIKWNGTSVDIFVNGTKQVSASAFTPTNMEFLRGAASDVPKFIQAMGLHPTPLTDAQCIEITTL
jgi:hypothetical protein